ncbi:MAG TPA: peptidoglycan DD-metalloendopeptidase family protein [Polyangia bacterium]|jgi:murein DD-endopeptidase MepM/ murein hydrolase activator NlpD
MNQIRSAAEGAKTLESILLKQLISDSGAFRGMSQAGGKIYGEMFCEALANAVAQGGGIGIAKLVEGSFEKGAAVAPSGASDPNIAGEFLFDHTTHTTNVAGKSTDATNVTPEVSSGFGVRHDPINGTQRFHTGVDVAAQEGSPVLAAAPGVVRSAGRRGGYGNAVEIDTGGGISTLYGHASALAVKKGDSVKTGQPVAFVGHTGRATGSHLHFEVRKDGKPIDPQPALNRWGERADVLIGRKP